jgi:hypothetical protein
MSTLLHLRNRYRRNRHPHQSQAMIKGFVMIREQHREEEIAKSASFLAEAEFSDEQNGDGVATSDSNSSGTSREDGEISSTELLQSCHPRLALYLIPAHPLTQPRSSG